MFILEEFILTKRLHTEIKWWLRKKSKLENGFFILVVRRHTFYISFLTATLYFCGSLLISCCLPFCSKKSNATLCLSTATFASLTHSLSPSLSLSLSLSLFFYSLVLFSISQIFHSSPRYYFSSCRLCFFSAGLSGSFQSHSNIFLLYLGYNSVLTAKWKEA